MPKKATHQKVTHRLDRVAEMIQRQIAELLEFEINDSRVKGATITQVKMSPDLQHASVYFTLLKEENIDVVTKALNHTASFLRRRIAEDLSLRIVPQVHFHYDQQLRDSQHLLEVLNRLRDE